MHRLPKIFAHSSNRRESGHGSSCGASSSSSRVAGKAKRLDRLNAKKNINYDYSASDSASYSLYSDEQSLHSRSLDLYDGKTSFRIDGVDGEFEMMCERLGFSGIDDFAIPTEEYEAMKVKSSFAPVVFIQNNEHLIGRELEVNCDAIVELAADSGDGGGSVDAICREIEGNNVCVGLAENRDDIIGENCKEVRDFGSMSGNRAKFVGARLIDDASGSDVMWNDNVSERYDQLRGNGIKGNGIKGVRPPVLVPPPLMSLPVIDKDCSTWDIFRAFAPESDTSTSRFEYGFCFDEGCDQERSKGDNHGDDRRTRVLGRQESYNFSGSCSFNTSLNDDDSSSTTTDPMSSISPNGRFRPIISEWQKGGLLGRGSFGSVYEGITDDGFFFAVKEVSLLDQGDEGQQRIIQLEQEIALLSQFEHENIVQYYGTRKDESHLYIFLELVTKGSLLSLYQRYNLRDCLVSAYTRQILHGLKYLHDRNVVHRDVKCANILVDTNGQVKLADFGLAKATKLNDVNSCKGTAFWMAPEVVQNRAYGLAADIWSLGCTVLEMLTRHIPYYDLECMQALFKIGMGERPPIPDTILSNARNFILTCLQVDPSSRPTASQLLDHPFVQQPLPSSSGFMSPPYFGRLI